MNSRNTGIYLLFISLFMTCCKVENRAAYFFTDKENRRKPAYKHNVLFYMDSGNYYLMVRWGMYLCSERGKYMMNNKDVIFKLTDKQPGCFTDSADSISYLVGHAVLGRNRLNVVIRGKEYRLRRRVPDVKLINWMKAEQSL